MGEQTKEQFIAELRAAISGRYAAFAAELNKLRALDFIIANEITASYAALLGQQVCRTPSGQLNGHLAQIILMNGNLCCAFCGAPASHA